MQARVARQLPRVVVVSENSINDIHTDFGVPRENMRLVPVGVDPELFKPLPHVERQPGRLITTASADVALKGLSYLLEALAKLRTERDVTLTVIGRPKPGGRSAEAIEKLGLTEVVSFVSGVPDERIVELYAEAELAIVPSLYEGFSLPAAEAMATGTALVATTGGALPEVTGTDGETVLSCPAGDADALAATIRRGLDDPALRAKVGAAGRERVISRWSWTHTATATVEQYRELLDMPRARSGTGTHQLMLTVDYAKLGVRPGDRLLDLGCGFGRHAFEAARRGARVVACDMSDAELKEVRATFGAMAEAGQVAEEGCTGAVNGDAVHLPFTDAAFDRVIASEVMEHIPNDSGAMHELARVLRPGGTIAVTVPAWLPEKVCWMLSDEYHAPFVEGGHVRIYTEDELRVRMRSAGLVPGASHRAHSLHSAYWWLRCAVGPTNETNKAVVAYRKLLEWDITKAPVATRTADRILNPVLGKSLVVYAQKPDAR